MNWYNDNEKARVADLELLVAKGNIPQGVVSGKDIREIEPNEIKEHTQCHFFAGIGGWPLALELAGWPTDRPVWTGSCPCQPFSVAGKRKGTKDERHLWPEWFRLIEKCRPSVVLGEQVASPAGREWLSGVRAEMETLGYAVGAADLCAASVGAPHMRQRLFWVAYTIEQRPQGHARNGDNGGKSGQIKTEQSGPITESGCVGRLADSNSPKCQRKRLSNEPGEENPCASGRGETGGMGYSTGDNQRRDTMPRKDGKGVSTRGSRGPGFWDDFDLIGFTGPEAGKVRRIKPGIEPMAHGVSGRVARLRGLGNAIVPQVAAEFVKAFMEVTG